MKGLKMKPSLGNIKSDDGLERFYLKKKKRERERGREGKRKKRGKKKEKLLKIEYGLTHGLSMLFSPLVENNTFFFFFLKKTTVCLLFVYRSLLRHDPCIPLPPFLNKSHVKLITGLTASSFYF